MGEAIDVLIQQVRRATEWVLHWLQRVFKSKVTFHKLFTKFFYFHVNTVEYVCTFLTQEQKFVNDVLPDFQQIFQQYADSVSRETY